MADVTGQPVQDSPSSPTRGTLAALLWACFLGCSWTWVIGMYFPLLLLRDYGIWGWVVFAVPNVLGAAAMGFVLKHPDVSRRLVQKHRNACLIFSQITVAYQIYMVTAFTGLVAWPILLVMAYAFLFAGRTGGTGDGILAVGVWVLSLVAFGYLQARGWLWLDVGRSLEEAHLTGVDLLMFAPASLFGFALCPYLDLTFHRARQATDPGTGRAAFALGFGIVFFSMIVFSLAYAGALLWPFVDRPTDLYFGVWQVFRWHLLMQAAFTIAVHWRSMDDLTRVRGEDGKSEGGYTWPRKLTLALAAGILAMLAYTYSLNHIYQTGDEYFMMVTELVYRLFLLFYGTVFPGYVLLVMIPTYRQVSHKAKIVVYLPTALLSYFLSYQAFVANHALWVLWILALIVVARLAVEMLPAESEE